MKPIAALLLVGALCTPTAGNAYNEPWGAAIRSAPGVKLYQSGASYVVAVRSDQGAKAILRHGTISASGVEGFKPVDRRSLQSFWNEIDADPRAFAMANAAFFDPGSDPSGIALPMKVSGNTFAHGYATSCWVGVLRILKIWDDRFRIEDYSGDLGGVVGSTSQNIIGGLTEGANCPTHPEVGNCAGEACKGGSTDRTFVGCADPQGAGDYATLLILTTSANMTGVQAGNILRSFGAGPTMMLDGGGSTQLIYRGPGDPVGGINPILGRDVNSVIGVLAADVTSPTAPTNLSVSPTGCSQTNSFTFSWTASADGGGSGLAGYEWNLDGGAAATPTPGLQVTTSAPTSGGYTFYVRAYDQAGNRSPFATIGFCYQPPTGQCAIARVIPNSCVPASVCFPASAASLEMPHDLPAEHWATVGQPVHDLLQPGKTYSIGLEYRSSAATEVKLGLGALGSTPGDFGVVVCRSALPVSSDSWKTFWSAPFIFTAEQLDRYSTLRMFCANKDSGVQIRNARIVSAQ